MRQPQIPAHYLPIHVVRLPRRRGTRRLGSHHASFFAVAAAHNADAIQYRLAESVRLPHADALPSGDHGTAPND
ncbi:hypothetical protein AURDEDRAFT_178211 [Auricularia subglabra TFB-10046 SS5]|uniref:Uncharacterized protein n=1 Tax=Auricularia subglabra (strain TFB-10046 / SS5) TaxID=717982 RepID=J0D251_AURST|nr:hypothetical protein AURDEDRAFT_178211 [Auricularia subglabra TFB-10046 SS5]